MKRKNYLQYFKLFFALLGIVAVLTEIIVLNARGIFNPFNFFSFFTIQSNIFAAVMLFVSACVVGRNSSRLNFFRGAATLYMVMTGAIFAVLLSNIDPRLLTAVPWDNVVLHYIMPVVMLLDWIIDRSHPPVRLQRAVLWLIVPLVYVVYTLVRGPLVDWYPYPFLNPNITDGYGSIALTSLVITSFVLISIWVIVRMQYLVVQPSKRRVS